MVGGGGGRQGRGQDWIGGGGVGGSGGGGWRSIVLWKDRDEVSEIMLCQ